MPVYDITGLQPIWNITNNGGAAAQATITKAAGAAGVRHIALRIWLSIANGATAQTALAVNLRDGATGAGTIVWSTVLSLPSAGNALSYDFSNLYIIGTAATAMTIETASATAAGVSVVVNLQGADVS